MLSPFVPGEPPSPRIALLTTAALAFHAAWLTVPSHVLARYCGYASLLVCVVSALLREPRALHATLLFALISGWWLSAAPLVWPLYFLVPVLAYGFAARTVRPLRRTLTWPRVGRVDRITVAFAIATVVVSSLALVAWLRFLHPNLDDIRDQIPSDWSKSALVGLGIAFALGNAVLEEIIWRGVVMESLEAGYGRGIVALVLQAVSFGAAHIAGFPRGWFGVAMAFVYGIALGVIRRRGNGLAAPIVTHVFADATIWALLIRSL